MIRRGARRGRAWLAPFLLAGLLAPAVAPAAGLRVLLTNDDGHEAVGIQSLKRALRAAGHHVTLVAPLGERSGSGAGIVAGEITAREVGEGEWAVDAPPAACVFIGLTAILDEIPDLVVSGANYGNNVGPTTPFSGTVGGGIAALHAPIVGAPGPIPAIIVSSDPVADPDRDAAGYARHYEHVAAFTVRLIDHLARRHPSVVPPGLALSVNYPARAPEDVLGIKIAALGKTLPDFRLRYELADDRRVVQTRIEELEVDVEALDEAPGSDVEAFHRGFITIVALDGDYSVGPSTHGRIAELLRGLEPTERPSTPSPAADR